MGCDIHMWVERKETDGKWHLVPDAKVYNYRSYRLFGFLAGVCGDGPAIAEPRGWPDDMSDELEQFLGFDFEGPENYDNRDKRLRWPGDHTPSWLTADEILKALAALPQGVYEWDPRAKYIVWEPDVCRGSMLEFERTYAEYWANLAKSPSDVRIVFNFDS